MPVSTAAHRDRPAQRVVGEGGPPDEPLLVTRLGSALANARVRYCQWKGHAKRDRWSAGDGDVDLLVARPDARALVAVLHGLGFKLALPPLDREVPGVLSYLGLDTGLGRLVHVHLHCHLVIGRAWGRHYRLPIEQAVLDTTVQRSPFTTPAPVFELLLFVLRTVLRHSPRDARYRGRPPWLLAIQPELERFETEVSSAALVRAVTRHVPEIDAALFERCRDTLLPGRPLWHGLAARYAIDRRLRAHLHRPTLAASLRRLAGGAVRRTGLSAATCSGKRLAHGGALIALIGADGAGKSTCARALETWLAPELRVRRAHMGRAPRSALTRAAGALLKAAQWLEPRGHDLPSSAAAHFDLLRCVCTARDRYRLYRRIRRFTRTGGLAICERYPIHENRALVGPSAAQGRAATADSWLATLLRRIETRYYALLTPPDLVIVLRVDPETAIHRKPEEPPAYVRARAGILWETRWRENAVMAVDARRPLTEVLAELRIRIWEAL